jgi:hypothetical protein
MRRKIAIAAAAGVLLVPVGVAVAQLTQDGTQAVSATFSAARERGDLRTCTGPDGTYEIVKGRYAGQSQSSQPTLSGPIVLNIAAVYNQTEHIGWMTGSLRIRTGDQGVTTRLVGTLTQGPSDTRILDGFVNGPAGKGGTKLFGNVTSSFTGTGGFTGGKIGEGGANIALLSGRVCKPAAPAHVEVEGRIDTLTSSAITVRPNKKGSAPQTCQIRSGVSPSTQNLHVGDRVEIECGLVDNSMTLLKVKKKGGGDDD